MSEEDGSPEIKERKVSEEDGSPESKEQRNVSEEDGSSESKERRDVSEKDGSPKSKERRLTREALPIDMFKDEILAAVEASPVIVCRGETGCGKTTQVQLPRHDRLYFIE